MIVVLLPRDVGLDDLSDPDVQFPTIDSLRTYDDIDCGNPGTNAIAYITSEFDDNFFGTADTLDFTVGDSDSPNDRQNQYTNGLLCFATSYTFFVRAYTEAVSRLILTLNFVSESHAVQFLFVCLFVFVSL